jgi:hypothetical protein
VVKETAIEEEFQRDEPADHILEGLARRVVQAQGYVVAMQKQVAA